MIRNYLTIALRNLVKNPLLTFIKVAGLTVGVCGCLIVFLLIKYEFSFNKQQPHSDRVYRIYSTFKGTWEGTNGGTPVPLAQYVKDNFTGVEKVAGFFTYSTNVQVVKPSGEKLKFPDKNKVVMVDADFFDVFGPYDWIAGSPKQLDEPMNVAIMESSAIRYFGSADPSNVMGKSIIYRDSLELTVTGLIRDIKANTDIDFTDFISYSTTQKSFLKNEFAMEWGSTSSGTQCFIMLTPGTSLEKIEAQLPSLVKMNESADDPKEKRTTFTTYNLQPLSDLHFNHKVSIFNGSRTPASRDALTGLMAVAGLLLLIAVINFINLETAQAIRRAKEVGVRKVMGGTRKSLVTHFLAENLLLSLIAILLALPLAMLCIFMFSEFLPPDVRLTISDSWMLVFLVLTWFTVSLLAGLYPSLVLSNYQPAVALKNQMASGRQSRTAYLRKVLTVFQFTFSHALIVCALIVGWQISFLVNKDLGFTTGQVVHISTPWWEKGPKRKILRNELEQIAGISSISQNQRPPAWRGLNSTTMTYTEGGEEIPFSSVIIYADTSYLSIYNLKIIAGRNFLPYDSLGEKVVNKKYCDKLGIEPIDMIGKTVKGNGRTWKVVGVVNDFHYQSLREQIIPVSIGFKDNMSGMSVALAGNVITTDVMDKLNAAWKNVYPDADPSIQFVDEEVNKFYDGERRTSKLANTATGLAIFISCLGLLGLASFTAVQRTKEIGIRKVMGATANNIVLLLSKDFLILVAVAMIIAIPLAWYVANEWLSSFAYRMDVSMWIFVVSGVISILIALVTVGSQALKASMGNPADTLRYE